MAVLLQFNEVLAFACRTYNLSPSPSFKAPLKHLSIRWLKAFIQSKRVGYFCLGDDADIIGC
jgi:hypothetical protein